MKKENIEKARVLCSNIDYFQLKIEKIDEAMEKIMTRHPDQKIIPELSGEITIYDSCGNYSIDIGRLKTEYVISLFGKERDRLLNEKIETEKQLEEL